jgi:lipoprotein-releasing system permease protein
MTRLELEIAGRYLRSRRYTRIVSLITLIATGGVTVGVMALMVVMGVMNGLQDELRDKILVASPHLRILTYGEGLRVDDWRDAMPAILSHPEVETAAPFVLSQGLLSAGADYAEGVRLVGIEADTGQASVTDLPSHFVQGDLKFTTRLDDVDGVWSFEVTGLFETGMFEYDNSYAVVSLDVGQRFAGLDSAVSGIDVRLTDPWDAPRVGAELERLLDYPYRSLDWQTQNASLFGALKLEKLAMGLILLLIVIVAAFNIVGTLTMVVTDKTREIGILRAMGLPSRAVKAVFVLQGAIIGMVGTGLGTTLGLVVAWLVDRGELIELKPEVYFIDHLPIQIQPLDCVVIVVASMAVATLATIYPSRRAAGMAPVEAIRHE